MSRVCLVAIWLAATAVAQAQTVNLPAVQLPDAVIIHPYAAGNFMCLDHGLGEQKELGINAGVDCFVTGGFVENGPPEQHFLRFFANDGLKNEDWYGWGRDVLAPVDAIVETVIRSTTVNQPGVFGKGQNTSKVVFQSADGVRILYAHLQDISVETGQRVKAGQPIGKVGNNGFSWAPHVHIGAWKAERPLSIRFDQAAMTRLRKS